MDTTPAPRPAPVHRCGHAHVCPFSPRRCATENAKLPDPSVWADPSVNGESKYAAR